MKSGIFVYLVSLFLLITGILVYIVSGVFILSAVLFGLSFILISFILFAGLRFISNLTSGFKKFIRKDFNYRIHKNSTVFKEPAELFNMMADEFEACLYEYKEMAYRDPLTHFYNLLYIEDNIEEILKKISGESLCILMIDLDNFKSLNDEMGHIAGDHYIMEYARMISSLLKEENKVLFRYGGDEFLIFIGGDRKKGESVSRKILKTVKEYTFEWYGKKRNLTASIGGIFVRKENLGNIEDVLHRIDILLYKAKEKRNAYVIEEFI